jgi:signal transduction histidine kinase/CheY-like chemotaxis protein
MVASQQIFRVRRQYNQWVGDQTLEDFALRFTATRARKWTVAQVAKTALGATAFMALEALAASVTLNYGFTNSVAAILVVGLLIFVIGLPVCYHAAKSGLDIDLLTRSAGFGYLGSTITSLIYASFTFIFFAIEAAILAAALQALFGIPLAIGYVLCAVAVVPIVMHGITAISKFQIGTQNLWLILQFAALAVVAVTEYEQLGGWTEYTPSAEVGNDFNIVVFGAAAAVLFSMIAQIGEQVDYLRFMPEQTKENRRCWWFWLLAAGPGWIVIGVIKMLLGSFMAYLAVSDGLGFDLATDPTHMYLRAFQSVLDSPNLALILAASMVILSQMKINVTNAYAGSIAWSNFFSRLTHSHPGRVVWLIFNVLIALLLMELGIYRALESILVVFAIVAISWLSSVSADLMINKKLGLSPAYSEFKRAHLYDINPVGVGSMLISSTVGIAAYLGVAGETARALAHFISIGCCFVLVPTIAWLTKGRYYLARESEGLILCDAGDCECSICESRFERSDMAYCPAYQGPICSLCCSLDARCMDSCKPDARIDQQLHKVFKAYLPERLTDIFDSRVGRFISIFGFINVLTGALFAVVYAQVIPGQTQLAEPLSNIMWTLYGALIIVFGVISWLYLLAQESREVAQQESNRQTQRLIEEVEANKVTDHSLRGAKELAERANQAKTRYLSGISHELRTPLQSILGYAQLLTKPNCNVSADKGLQIIKRNGEYLADLIEGVLDISKIEAGRLEIFRNRFNLPEFLDQIVEIFAPQAEAKGIQFNYLRTGNLPQTVISDQKRLRQILINLLSNAVKYTQSGHVTFAVQYRNQVAEFRVEDSGVGIMQGDIKRIMEPFERANIDQVANEPGTGLGLTIVRLLTEVMGGDLKVESEQGVGSSFTVSLMLSRVDTPLPKLVQPSPIIGYEGEPLPVMIVDDEDSHRELLTDLLQPLGFVTYEAGDAASCLQMAQDISPALFLLDVSMPGTDGLMLARMLRERGLTAPIIMVSADAQERHAKSDSVLDHDFYLVKPINTAVLLDNIGRLMKLRWRYQKEEGRSGTEAPTEAGNNGELSDAAVAQLRELHRCGSLGYSQGVSQAIAALAAKAEVSELQLERIRSLAVEYRYELMCQEIDELLSHEH